MLDRAFTSLNDWFASPAAATWVTAAATLMLVAVAGIQIWIAETAKRTANQNAAKTRTLDLIHAMVSADDLNSMFRAFRVLCKKYESGIQCPDIIRDYNDYHLPISFAQNTPEKKHDFDVIIEVLNFYETWEIGIENKALDENMLRDWWRSSAVRDFLDLYEFVLEHRDQTDSPALFVKIEALVRRWARPEEQKQLDVITRLYKKRRNEVATLQPTPAPH